MLTTKPGYVPGATAGFITDTHRQFYADNGFLVVEDGLSRTEIDQLNAEALAICRGDRGQYAGWVGPHDDQSDADVLRQYLCIHFPHKISPLMYDALAQRAIVETLTNVISPNVKCMQSMLFIKAAGKPGQAWHQDEDYIPTRDRSLAGAWMALDDATVENGCLWVIPGSHKHGILWPQHEHNDRRFDCALESREFPYTDDDAVPVEVKAGSIVFFNGYLLHRSLPNRAATGYRRVLVNHYMSAESLLPWRYREGTGMAKQDYRDIVMIAGRDPYAHEGITDLAKPSVRPSGEGGCESWQDNRKRKVAAK